MKPTSEIDEIQTALINLQTLIGQKAYISFDIKPGGLSGCLYPDGVASTRRGELSERISANKGGWREIIANLHEQYIARAANREENLTRDIALAIIRITFETGGCSDAQLRAGFDASDVGRLGQAACERANSMADKGPFVLTILSGANDAEAA